MKKGGQESLADLVKKHRIVVCAGSGGVGKTTTAASLALWGALQGRRAIVLTIDPARRLADSLGVGPIGNTPIQVAPDKLDVLPARGRGSLTAMMLDQKGSWDELVSRHAPSEEVRGRILENAFYRQLSQSFAGSQEYMAVEQLGELEASGQYDLIVVDTPPTQHALDFLEAPDRLLAFLDRKIIKWFVRPSMSAGWSTLQTMNRTVGFLMRRIEEATGMGTLSQVSAFFADMSQLFDGFEARVERVTSLLRDAGTAFILVAGPDEQVLGQVEYLGTQMAARKMPLKGVVMNRVHTLLATPELDESTPQDLADLIEPWVKDALGNGAAATRARRKGSDAKASPTSLRLAQNLICWQVRARGDALRIEMFRQGMPRGVPLVQVPNLPRDIHDLAGLGALHSYLFGEIH